MRILTRLILLADAHVLDPENGSGILYKPSQSDSETEVDPCGFSDEVMARLYTSRNSISVKL